MPTVKNILVSSNVINESVKIGLAVAMKFYHGGGCCESGGSERQKLKILSLRTGATD
jgi:hypothetical protein